MKHGERSVRKTVYFVRHGQTDANISPIFQSPDTPLNEKGREQARQIADRATRIPFETLISSPWPRAQETARFIQSVTGKEPIFSDLFVERIKPSRLNGRSYEDQEADDLWHAWDQSLYTPGHRVEDGENFDDLLARADAALTYLEKRPEESLLVVTHGFFLRTMVARVLLGDSLTSTNFAAFRSSAEMENTGLTVLQLREGYHGIGWRLWVFNDHTHLG